MYINVQFDYGGCYSEDHEWISRNALYAMLFKNLSLGEITYSMLVEKICRKIGVDETTSKLKLSYSLSKSRRETYIVDDEEVLIYLTAFDKDGLTPVLQVELLKGVENSEKMDQMSRANGGSSCGVNSRSLVLYSSVDEIENVDYRENASYEESGTVESPTNDHLDVSLDQFSDLPVRLEGIENVEEWEDGIGIEIKQVFCSRQSVQDMVLRAAAKNCFAYETVKSDKHRLMLRCQQASKGCKWYLRVARYKDSVSWTIRVHNKMHTCSQTLESTSSVKQRGKQRLIANLLHEDFPGQMDTPSATSIVNIVQTKLSIGCSYSTALRGKMRHVAEMRGSPEKNYKLLFSYLFELDKANPIQ